jgi:excisionase family DNA binding protein
MSEPNGTPGDRLLTVEEAAAFLRVRPATVYEWVRSGRMPCLRLGPRAIRFTKPMVESWALEQRSGPALGTSTTTRPTT